MSGETRHLQLRCPVCSWTEVCGPAEVANWLLKARKIRMGRSPELEIQYEIFRATAGQLTCPECGEVGLRVASAADDQMDWPGPKPCAACGRPISQARLQAMPGTTLCTACQQGEERGQSQGETEYCPRCGAPMELRLAKTGGLTRYVSVCTAKSACRPKSDA